MLKQKDFRKPAEVIADVLSRYSVRDLYEQSHEDLDAGEDKLYKAAEPIKIIEQGVENDIRWWKLESGEKNYEVRRFENFVFCSCMDFFIHKRMCKHLTITVRFYCDRCRSNLVDFGQMCETCQMSTSPYLPPAIDRKPERIGNVRI